MQQNLFASEVSSQRCYVPPNEVLYKVIHQGETKIFRQPNNQLSFKKLSSEVKRRFDVKSEVSFAALELLSKTYY